MFTKFLVPALAIAALGLPAALPAPAIAAAGAVDEAVDGKRKINLSGRQRMLSQRMAKAVCFAAIGVDSEAHMAMARDAHGLFDTTLAALRNGSAEVGMNPESDPDVLRELSGVEDLWSSYGAAIATAVESGAFDAPVMAEIAAQNVPTLVQMNAAVGAFERAYGGGDIHPALALAINVSGRQRMLTQKASKEFCLIAYGQDAEANRGALGDTVKLFNASLEALRFGSDDLGLPEAPTEELAEQLAKVDSLWAPLSEILTRVANGADATPDEITLVASQNNTVLVEMNRAVGMYEGL